MVKPNDTKSDDPEFSVRRYRPEEDGCDVARLLKDGLLPGRVEYEPRILDQIKSKLGSEREIFLVAQRGGGRLIGMLAVVEASPDIGHLHWLRVDPAWQKDRTVARALARAAVEHAREVGLLKLATHAPPRLDDTVAAYYHQFGFELSRTRDIDGVHVLEFYLNLYENPPEPD
jgi:predicted N-acetyltransferase YhbS